MPSTPATILEEANPEQYGDALSEVLEADKDMRRASARKAIALLKAHHELVSPVRFESRMLANRSFRAEVAALLCITEKAAENLVGYSKVLIEAFPATLAALKEARISWHHATVVVDELASMDDEAAARVEVRLLDVAPSVTPHKLARMARLERESADPESIPVRHEQAKQLRGVELLEDRDGMGGLYVRVPSVQAHAIFSRLTKAARAMGCPTEERTLDQRRADLFAHYLLASVEGEVLGIVPDEHDDEKFVNWFRGIRADVTITVPVLTLLGHSDEPATLDGWVPIDPGTAEQLAGNAPSFTRVLTHPETGATLSVGRKRYKTPSDMGRVVRNRDGTCRFPGCNQPAA